MSDEKKILDLVKEPYFHENHAKPITRRQMVAQGFLAGGAYVTLPTLLSLGSRVAKAAEYKCEADQGGGGGALNTGIACLTVDASGGYGFTRNFAVSKSETDPGGRPNYSNMGQFGNSLASVEAMFGAHMFKGAGTQDRNDEMRSFVLQGILETVPAAALLKMSLGLFCTTSLNDTSSNRNNFGSLIDPTGIHFSGMVGTRADSQAGGNAQPIFPLTSRALRVSTPADLDSAVSGSQGFGNANLAQKKATADAILKLAEQQKAQLGERMNAAEYLAAATNCSLGINRRGLDAAPDFNPLTDPRAVAVYRLNEQNIVGDLSFARRLRDATIVRAQLLGYVGRAATIEVQGCDYHGRTLAQQNDVDLEIGLTVGRALALAHAMGQPMMVNICSDGGIGYGNNNPMGMSDDAGKAGLALFTIGATTRYSLAKTQVGVFTDNGSADSTHFINSSNGITAAIAAYINWNLLSFGAAGLGARIAAKIPAGSFDSSRIGDVILFG